MKLGAYTAVLHDKPLSEALLVLRGLGLDGAEIKGRATGSHAGRDDVRAACRINEAAKVNGVLDDGTAGSRPTSPARSRWVAATR